MEPGSAYFAALLTEETEIRWSAGVDMPLEKLFASLNPVETPNSVPPPVLYLQSQNGNLAETGELHPLLDDVGDGPIWARDVFGEPLSSASEIYELILSLNQVNLQTSQMCGLGTQGA